MVAPAIVTRTDPASVWEAVRTSASASKYTATILGDLTFLGLSAGVARLVGPREIVQAAKTRLADLELLFRKASGGPVKVQIEPVAGEMRSDSPAIETGLDAPAALATPKASMQEHPLVRKAIDQLGATLIRVQPRIKPPSEPPAQGA